MTNYLPLDIMILSLRRYNGLVLTGGAALAYGTPHGEKVEQRPLESYPIQCGVVLQLTKGGGMENKSQPGYVSHVAAEVTGVLPKGAMRGRRADALYS